MAAQSPKEPDDYSLYISENGHLSFENPNYQLEALATIDPARLDDHLNSNIQPTIPVSVYEELCQELDKYGGSPGATNKGVMDLQQQPTSGRLGQRASLTTRKAYASLDVHSMGVDVSKGPLTNLDNKLIEEVVQKDKSIEEEDSKKSGDIESKKLVESATEKETTVVVRRRPKKQQQQQQQITKSDLLPCGWEKHEDENGFYYWHIKSGTIQRDPPQLDDHEQEEKKAAAVRDVRSSMIFEDDYDAIAMAAVAASSSSTSTEKSESSMSKSCTSSSIVDLANKETKETSSSVEQQQKRRSLPPSKNDDEAVNAGGIRPMQVGVRSLGWVELNEDALTSENSSKAVNRCIVQLSSSGNATLDPVGLWGGGKELTLELDEGTLKLVEPESKTVLNSQPIHTIRVWGVGRDNSRDFAYVARDKHTRRHTCHVFRCDVPARAIANTLRDICKKILIERSLAQSSSKLIGQSSVSSSTSNSSTLTSSSSSVTSEKSEKRHSSRGPMARPTSLGPSFNDKLKTKTVPAPESFPTPMEEPRKVLKAFFLGTLQVTKPGGMEVINEAINTLMTDVAREDWKMVSVAVAPSTVTIQFTDGQTSPLDCRVRFLSFLGIGRDIRTCAFVVHTAQDTFVSHIFYCEPNAGPLCKTIEAACKLRYQKCLDARPQQQRVQHSSPSSKDDHEGGHSGRRAAALGATLKNMFGSLASKRNHGQPESS